MYVMTPEFGAASQLEKIDMLTSPSSWPSTSSTARGADDALRDVASSSAAQQGGLQDAGRADAGLRHHGQPLQRRRRDRALPGPEAAAALGLNSAEGRPPAAWWTRATARTRTPIVPARACATWPRSPTPCAATKRHTREQAALAREIQQLQAARMLREDDAAARRRRQTRAGPGRGAREARLTPTRREAAGACGPTCRAPTPATSTW